MAAPIRPNLVPSQPLGSAGAPPAARAAQRAFFDAALGKAGAVASAPAAAVAPARPATAPVSVPKLDLSEPPQRVLRPGSLLNIVV